MLNNTNFPICSRLTRIFFSVIKSQAISTEEPANKRIPLNGMGGISFNAIFISEKLIPQMRITSSISQSLIWNRRIFFFIFFLFDGRRIILRF